MVSNRSNICQRDNGDVNRVTYPNISVCETRLCELLGQTKVAQFDSVTVIKKY